MDDYLGMIRIFGGNYAPQGYMLCQGQILNIAQSQALYAVLGTAYGGDGRTTFALPNFSGRSVVGTDTAGKFSPGSTGGSATATLTANNLPAHTHTATATSTLYAEGADANDNLPGGNLLANSSNNTNVYTAPVSNPNAPMASDSITTAVTIGVTGSSQPFNVTNPYIAMNYVICVEGMYPARN